LSPLAAATSRQTLARASVRNKPPQNGDSAIGVNRKRGADLRRIIVPFRTCYKPRRDTSH